MYGPVFFPETLIVVVLDWLGLGMAIFPMKTVTENIIYHGTFRIISVQVISFPTITVFNFEFSDFFYLTIAG